MNPVVEGGGVEPGEPSGPAFIALLEAFRATGGTAPVEIVGRLLEEHQVGDAASLALGMDSGQVLGFEWRGSLWLPMFQFDADDLSLKASARIVRAALPADRSGWRVAAWFAAAQVQLDGHCPAEMLDSAFGAVLRAACALDTFDGGARHRPRRVQAFAQPA